MSTDWVRSLYCALTGRPPITGSRMADVLTRIVAGDLMPALKSLRDDIPVALVSIVDRCLNSNPNERFQSAADVSAALKSLNADQFNR